jgi:hypothetical protein
MTTFELKATDVIAILKEARKAGVSRLKYGDLFVEFDRTKSITQNAQLSQALHEVTISDTQMKFSDLKDAEIKDPAVKKEIEMANLLMEDESAFEREMIVASLETERLNEATEHIGH